MHSVVFETSLERKLAGDNSRYQIVKLTEVRRVSLFGSWQWRKESTLRSQWRGKEEREIESKENNPKSPLPPVPKSHSSRVNQKWKSMLINSHTFLAPMAKAKCSSTVQRSPKWLISPIKSLIALISDSVYASAMSDTPSPDVRGENISFSNQNGKKAVPKYG